VFFIIATACFSFGQADHQAELPNSVTKGTLQVAKTVTSNDVAREFTMPLQCDGDGNVYSRSDSDGFPSIHKISLKGENSAAFAPSSCSDIKVQHTGEFFVAQDGHLYQVAFPVEDKPHVLIFNDDGTCHSKIKLDTPFSFIPYQLVVFPSGNMLISGTRWRAQLKQYISYTALFSSSGTVLKDVDLNSDPEKPQSATGKGDGEGEQGGAISGGAMLLAGDNNAYLIRREATPTIYTVSEGGVVTRHFRVDPGEPDLVTAGMQITGNRIAILFGEPMAHRALIKIVDLEGKGVAQYDVPTRNGRITLPLTLACYTYPPEAFTFLSTAKDDKLALKIVEPR